MNKAKAVDYVIDEAIDDLVCIVIDYATVDDSIYSAVRSEIRRAVDIAVSRAVSSAVFSSVRNSVCRVVDSAVSRAVDQPQPTHITTEVNRIVSEL